MISFAIGVVVGAFGGYFIPSQVAAAIAWIKSKLSSSVPPASPPVA